MVTVRKSFQGIFNIVRFNWHFYVIALAVIVLAIALQFILPSHFTMLFGLLGLALLVTISISLLVSYYVYDLSELYKLDWLKNIKPDDRLVNIHAGFDETSEIINSKFPENQLSVFDFYDPEKHTEVSIKRARCNHQLYPGTQSIKSTKIPHKDQSADKILLFLSAHEIRDPDERAMFFQELHRILALGGEVIVVEHLRDITNFLAYNIGFLHFHSESTWIKSFEAASLSIVHKQKITPFITLYKLKKNGITS